MANIEIKELISTLFLTILVSYHQTFQPGTIKFLSDYIIFAPLFKRDILI